MPRARWAETRGARGGQPWARARRGRGGARACAEKPALSGAASGGESGTRRGAARRQRWVRGGPGTGRDSRPRVLGGYGAGSPAVTAAGVCRGRGRGGPTVGPWSEVGRGGWPRHGGLGPGPPACHCPSRPPSPRGPRLRGTLTPGAEPAPLLPAVGVSQRNCLCVTPASGCFPFVSRCGVGNPPLDSKLQQNL